MSFYPQGWMPSLDERLFQVDPNSWGQRKLDAIRDRRKAQHDAGLDSSFLAAKQWVEDSFPEFRNKPD